MFKLESFATILWMLFGQVSPGPAGVISAKVLDQNGRPLAGATVQIDEHPRSIMRIIPECTTNEAGVCSRSDFQMGTYTVTASKVADGYPNIGYEFYGRNRKPIEVDLTPQSPIASVVLTLGPKAAAVQVHPIDDETGAAVSGFAILLWNIKNPHELLGVGKTPDSTVLVPPDENIEMKITAKGYLPWVLSEHPEIGKGRQLRLHSGEKSEIVIRLHPE